MKRGKWLMLGVLGLAFIVNPYVACSSSNQSDFTYSETEMQESVLGTWEGTARLDGETVPFSLVLEQASTKSKPQTATPSSVTPQCASRSFVKPAGACLALTSMPVVGTLTSENPSFNGAVDGTFTAYRTLDSVSLELHVEGGAVLVGNLAGQTLSDGQIGSNEADRFSLARP